MCGVEGEKERLSPPPPPPPLPPASESQEDDRSNRRLRGHTIPAAAAHGRHKQAAKRNSPQQRALIRRSDAVTHVNGIGVKVCRGYREREFGGERRLVNPGGLNGLFTATTTPPKEDTLRADG